jgi:alpha-N-arabinofuranosidase
MHFSRLGRGRVLRIEIDSPTYAARYNDPNGPDDTFFPLPSVPYLKLAAVHDPEGRRVTLFALNRSLTDELPLRLKAMGYDGLSLKQAVQLHEADLKAINCKAEPDRVTPRPLGAVRVGADRVEATLAPASWNVIEVGTS